MNITVRWGRQFVISGNVACKRVMKKNLNGITMKPRLFNGLSDCLAFTGDIQCNYIFLHQVRNKRRVEGESNGCLNIKSTDSQIATG